MNAPHQPLISYAALERAFSAPRLRAYQDPQDRAIVPDRFWVDEGPESRGPRSEMLLGSEAGLRALPMGRFNALGRDRQRMVAEVIEMLIAAPDTDAKEVVQAWVELATSAGG